MVRWKDCEGGSHGQGVLQNFPRGTEESHKKPVTLVGVMAMIQTEHILNTVW